MRKIVKPVSVILSLCIFATLFVSNVYAAEKHNSNSFSSDIVMLGDLSGYWKALPDSGDKINNDLSSFSEDVLPAVTFSDGATPGDYDTLGERTGHGQMNGYYKSIGGYNSGKEKYVSCLANVQYLDGNNVKLIDIDKTFGISGWKDKLDNFTGNGLINVYHSTYYTSGASSVGFYLGCDYSPDTHSFIYYFVGVKAYAGNKDAFASAVFKSQDLYYMDGANSTDSTSSSDVAANLLLVGESIQSYSNKNVFGEIINNNAGMAYSGILDELNNIFSVNDDLSNLTLDIRYEHLLHCDSDLIMSTIDGSDNIHTYNVDGIEDVLKNKIGWGLSTNNTGYKKVDTVRADAASFIASILTHTVDSSAGGNASDNLENLLKSAQPLSGSTSSEDVFTYKIFKMYSEYLKEMIKSTAIDDPVTAELNLNDDDPFITMQKILKYHLKYLKEHASTNWTGVVEWTAIGKTIRIAQSGDAGSDADMGLSDLWGMLDNDYQRAVLYTNYIGKLSNIGRMTDRFLGLDINVDTSSDHTVIYPGDTVEIREMIEDKYIAEGFDSSGVVGGVARICNIASRYIVASTLYQTESSSDGVYAFELYNDQLESMVSAIWYNGEDLEDYYLAWMPKRIPYILGDDGSGYLSFYEVSDISWKRMVALLANVETAFESFTYSMYGKDNDLAVDDLREFFSGNADKAPAGEYLTWMKNTDGMDAWRASALDTNFDGDSWTIELLRCIIELHDMCTWMGIEKGDWSEVIDAYLEIYDDNTEFFSLLRNNNYIYKRAQTGVMTRSEPLGRFFSIEDKSTSDQWNKGFALSALYVPMETNLYDANSITFLGDPDWTSDFYYKYAFYRKALYINTDSSAIVNKAVTGQDSSGKKVATLRDLLSYDRDIILTIDDNFYNANQVSEIIDKVDYGAVRNAGADEDEAELNGNAVDKFENWAAGLFDLDAGTILKTGANMYYSQNLAENVTQLGQDKSLLKSPYDNYILSDKEILGDDTGNIKSVLDEYEYTVKQSFGVVSAIYRNAELYNECLRAITADNAIFKSSINVCKTPGTSASDWRCIYNYAMLSNLDSQMKNNTSTTLDLDAPIFCDLFGNIVTESGLVIIPAAANATLCGSLWTPYTVGWSEYYNNGNRIPVDILLEDVYTWLLGRQYTGASTSAQPQLYSEMQAVDKSDGGGYMSIDNSAYLVLRDVELVSNNLTGIIQFEMPNKNSVVVQQLFFNDAYFTKAKGIYSHRITNMIVEVLRGAPIEYINYTYESLSGPADISKYGVYIAYKLEELMKAFLYSEQNNENGGNSIVTMPNLAFMTGVEYIMLYVFKIVFAVLLVALVVQLYLDATKNSLGLRSFGKFILTCMMVVIAFTLVPRLISWSYYKANKDLLADEAGYIMMLNYVKDYDGTEIGITSIETPETNTELYVRVSDVHVNWWKIIPEVLFGHTFSTVTELYEDTLKNDAMAMQKSVQLKGDGLYINVQDIYNSTNVMYTPSNSVLINYSTALTSYISPIDSYYQPGDSVVGSDGRDTGEVSDGTLWAYERDPETGERIPESQGGTQVVNKDTFEGLTVEPNDRDSVASFVMPYYVILDQLIANVNEYNASRGIRAYGWSVGANGHILTYDILTPYLTSAEFLEEGYDILGMQYVTKLEHPQPIYNRVITDDDIAKMEYSLWYPGEITNSLKAARLNELYRYARDYIADNRYVLGKVPDEVFIKVFAMQLAIKYNQIFNISEANAIEIINVDTRDLMRFMIGDKGNVYKYYSYGFARYCYEQSGVIGVIFSALLTLIYWLTSFLKAIAMALILTLLIFNCVFRKQLFHKDSRCIEGYLIACACLCLCNYAYSLMLKLSMILNDLGTGAITALIFAFLIQILYVAALLGIVAIEIKDWRNNGLYEFYNIGGNISSGLMHARNVVVEKLTARHSDAYSETAHSRQYVETNDNPTVGDMLARDAEREERGTYSPD